MREVQANKVACWMMVGRKMPGRWALALRFVVVGLESQATNQRPEEEVELGRRCKDREGQGSSSEHPADPTRSPRINRWHLRLTR